MITPPLRVAWHPGLGRSRAKDETPRNFPYRWPWDAPGLANPHAISCLMLPVCVCVCAFIFRIGTRPTPFANKQNCYPVALEDMFCRQAASKQGQDKMQIVARPGAAHNVGNQEEADGIKRRDSYLRFFPLHWQRCSNTSTGNTAMRTA